MKELLIASLLGIAVLALDILRLRKITLYVVIAGLAGIIGSCVLDWGLNENPFANNMMLMDNFALGFTMILASVLLCWFLMTTTDFANDSRKTDIYALALFSFTGAVMMVSFSNLVMLFLGIEILSIPMYVLAASRRGHVLSNEAGFKYFFLGAVASAILLFGIALVYGSTGTFDLGELTTTLASGNASGMIKAGTIMMLAGFAFKISAAPFHFWAPDVYQGSPTIVTALMATVVKGAAFAAMLRLFGGALQPVVVDFAPIIATLAALTLIAGNVIAAIQTNVKRLLAYSSISHAGFMLSAILIAKADQPGILMFYVLTYSVASLTSFMVLHHVSSIQNEADGFDSFKGLVKRNPILAGAMTLSLLSMAGIPPLSGFMAKYFVIDSVLSGGYTWLVIIMILSSVVAVYYYLRLIVAMFTPIDNAGRIVVTDGQRLLFLVFSTAMIVLFFGAGIARMTF